MQNPNTTSLTRNSLCPCSSSAEQLDPDNISAYYHTALLYAELRDISRALEKATTYV